MQAQYRFAAHVRDPDHAPRPKDVEDRRMAIYRELFYNNVEGFLDNGFPVLRSITPDGHWHKMVRDFFSRHRSHSPLFMEIPREFLVYLEKERGEVEGDPAFLWELAHYEWVEMALSIAEDPDEDPAVDPEGDLLEGSPAVSALAWPLSYQFPVHRIGPDFLPDAPGEEATHLVVYRDSSDEVGFIELNTVSARLLGLLLEDKTRTGRDVMQQIVEELQHPNLDAVVAGGREILEKWRELGIVVGVRDSLKL